MCELVISTAIKNGDIKMSNKEITLGINEIKSKYKSQIKFTDTLKCITYKK